MCYICAKDEDMEKKCQYKVHSSEGMVACEPALDCHASEHDVTYLPDDILVAAIKCADISRRQGKLIPQDKVYSVLSNRLGWK